MWLETFGKPLVSGGVRQQLASREVEEAFLVRPDLMDVRVCVARVFVLLQLLQVLLGIRAHGERLLELVCLASFDELLEVRGQRKLLRRAPFHERVRPDLERRLISAVLRLRPADGDLAVLRLAVPAAVLELLDDLLLRRDVDEREEGDRDRKSTRLNSSHSQISYAVF